MQISAARTDPPSDRANNQDVFIWAVYELGGSDRDVDVEEIYLKCFEIAPARLSWRTRPGIPDYKKASKALQSVEAKTHVGLLLKVNEYKRRLTAEGVRWIETYKPLFESLYTKSAVEASAANNNYERIRRDIKGSQLWELFIANPVDISLADVAPLLKCSAASPVGVWTQRINDLRRASDVLKDCELNAFADAVEAKVKQR